MKDAKKEAKRFLLTNSVANIRTAMDHINGLIASSIEDGCSAEETDMKTAYNNLTFAYSYLWDYLRPICQHEEEEARQIKNKAGEEK